MNDAPTQPIEIDQSHHGQTRSYQLQIPEDLAYFAGHFTQAPIVPGVALTHWAIERACQAFDHAPKITSIANLKFHHVLMPNDAVMLELVNQPDAGTTRFTYRQDETLYASGRINWR